jgi:DNA-binding NtrC family response regulator
LIISATKEHTMGKQPSARLLVVDDEPAILFTVAIMLRRSGYTVTTATNGTQAIALILREVFDLLLIDLKLPDMSGLDIAREARAHQPNAAIILLTGSNAFDGVPIEGRIGPFDCILKTASPQDVLAAVAKALQPQPLARAVGAFAT